MSSPAPLGVLLAVLSLAACASPSPTAAPTDTVFAVDFMRTLPGEQADYLRSLRLNWMRARDAAADEGFVIRSEVLVREPRADDWDVMLITEYASREAYDDRETLFARLFDRPEFALQRVDGKGPRDMATFVDSEVTVTRAAR